MTCEAVARQVGRTAEEVRPDLDGLANAGLLTRHPDGGVEFPFDAVHIDFVLRAA